MDKIWKRLNRAGLSRLLLISFLALIVPGCALATEPVLRTEASQRPKPTAAPSAAPSEPVSDSIDRKTSEPYTGSLSTFEDPQRDQKLQVNRVMDLLKIKEGSSVADIGAGSGWFTVRAARRVGNQGVVYAVDINNDFLKHIEDRARKEKLENVRFVLGKADDPVLPQESVDAVLILKTYHEVEQPIRLLKHIREAMRVGALLGVIDRDGKGSDHGIDRNVVIKEAERAGFVLVSHHDFVKQDEVDYFLIFQSR
jgi:predicted methyltransferase